MNDPIKPNQTRRLLNTAGSADPADGPIFDQAERLCGMLEELYDTYLAGTPGWEEANAMLTEIGAGILELAGGKVTDASPVEHKSRLVSPNEVMGRAKDEMLGGADPDGLEDQARLMHFIAANVDVAVADSICKLMKNIYPDELGLLTDEQVANIAAYQVAHKQEQRRG